MMDDLREFAMRELYESRDEVRKKGIKRAMKNVIQGFIEIWDGPIQTKVFEN